MKKSSKKQPYHIAEAYFYEELVKKVGHQISNDWIRSIEIRIETSSTSDSVQCSSPTSSSIQSRHTTPQSSSPSTPINGSFSLIGNIPSTKPNIITTMSAYHDEESHNSKTDFDKDQAIESKISIHVDKLSLLYTDAAHSVLQDKEVADYVKRRNSFSPTMNPR